MYVPQAQPGMDTHALTHALAEEFWKLSVDNVSAPLVTGTAAHASSVLTLKFGPPQDYHASALKETGMDSLALSALLTKSGSQPPCNVDAQADKIGTASHASPVQLHKTGMLLSDHVDAHSAKIGMEKLALHVSAEDNGMPSQDNVSVLLEAGMDSHVFNVLLGKPGTHPVSHAPAHQALFGMASTAEFVQVPPDSGIINLTIVSVEMETGTELNVSFAQSIATGMEETAPPALVEEFGTQLIWYVNVQMKLNGMVLDVSKPAPMERSFKMVSVSARLANSNKIKNVSTNQSARTGPTGMVNNVSEFHVMPVLHLATTATAVKFQFTPAQPVLIGMV